MIDEFDSIQFVLFFRAVPNRGGSNNDELIALPPLFLYLKKIIEKSH